MKRKIVSLLVGVSLVFSLFGCGQVAEVTSTHADRVNAHTQSMDDDDYVDVGVYADPSIVGVDDPNTNIEELTGMVADELFNRDTDIMKVSESGEGYNFNQSAELVDILGSEGKNTVVSATSLNMALGLLLEGAGSDTYDSINSYLINAYTADDSFDMSKRGNELMNSYMNDSYVTLNLANSVWTDSDIGLLDDYINNLKIYYNAEAASLDFNDASSSDIINDWCLNATNGKIREIIKPSTLLASRNILINALYFNGSWDEPFEDYQVYDEIFTDVNGNETDVEMMHSTEGIYLENDMATGFMKYYEGYDVAFVGILPKAEGDFTVSDLDINSLMDSATRDYDVFIRLPKFIVEDDNELSDALRMTGLSDIFSESADFSNMCTDTELFVSEIIQKTYVDVNEYGTEAAAVTAIVMNDSCAMIEDEPETREVYLNRPFVFMIYDKTNDEVLFMGKMNTID